MTDNILIIEGDSALRGELTSVLTKANFGVASAPGYFEALMKLDEFRPDMIIIDEVLPHRDVGEACCQLHRNLGIPIILLGRDSTSHAWAKAVEAGADFYLKKPFSYLELVARTKAILRRYKRLYHYSLSTDKEVMPIKQHN